MINKIIFGILALIIAISGYFYVQYNPIVINSMYLNYLNIGLKVIIILLVTFIINKIILLIFNKAVAKLIRGDSLAKKIMPIFSSIISIILWIIALFIVFGIIGINPTSLATGAGLTGVIIALVSKEAASNLIGSLSLVFSKSFKIGDYIRIKQIEGTVDEINLSYSRLVDKKGNYIFIPNKNIISESIENISAGKYKRQEIILPLPINLESKNLDKILSEIEKILEKAISEKQINNYKILFDSYNHTQNYLIQFEGSINSDMLLFKKELSLKIRKILDSQKVVFESN